MMRRAGEFLYQVMTGRRRVAAFILAPVLFLLSQAYRFAFYARSLLYDRRMLRSYRSPRKVISVGNLTMGGAGKTPVVRELLHLLRAGRVDAHGLSRGHGGRLKGPVRVDPARHGAADVGAWPGPAPRARGSRLRRTLRRRGRARRGPHITAHNGCTKRPLTYAH